MYIYLLAMRTIARLFYPGKVTMSWGEAEEYSCSRATQKRTAILYFHIISKTGNKYLSWVLCKKVFMATCPIIKSKPISISPLENLTSLTG